MPDESFTILRNHFGFEAFRPGQQEAIQSLLVGQHTLVVMPTGAGKSLIFQIVGLQMRGITMVISPLIALMKDQVDSLQRRNIPATFINSALPTHEQLERLSRLKRGDYRIVYIAPERLRSVPFLSALRTQIVSLLAVDEAHCISEWGHDFRPDYLYIVQARAILGNPLTVALTATATPQVQSDIIRLLGLTDANRIITGFNRPNLSLRVRYTSGVPAKLRALSELLSARDAGAVILYTGTRRDAEESAEFIRQVVKTPTKFYHAGVPTEERTRIQNDFISGKLNVIAATNAFGMGIDRSDVRQVIHYSIPGSLEAYYQEAGRAGRDGLPASVTLLYDPQDRALQEFFIEQSRLGINDLRTIHNAIQNGDQTWTSLDGLSQITGMHPVLINLGISLLERAGALEHLGDEGVRLLLRKGAWNPNEIKKATFYSENQIKNRQSKLKEIISYAESDSCRRQIILKYFGDTNSSKVSECCDNCRNRQPDLRMSESLAKMTHGERAALVILDCINHVQIKVGREKIAQILHGSKAGDILKLHHNRNIYYGRLAAVNQKDIEALIGQLIEKEYIKVIGGKFLVLSLTPEGKKIIQRKELISSRLPKSPMTLEAPKKLPKGQLQRIVELGKTKSRSGIHELIAALESPNGNSRRLAASALGKMRTQLAVEPLLKLLENEAKPQVRQYAVKALGRIGEQKAAKMLEKIVRNEQEIYYVRQAAKIALKQLKNSPADNAVSAKWRPHFEVLNSETFDSDVSDPVLSFLNASHPRPLTGPWQSGWSLGFHSSFVGGDWARSGIGDLTYRLKYEGDLSVLPALVTQALELTRSCPELIRVDVILPVPPSQPRETEPVQAFSKALSDKIMIPVQSFLFKTRHTQPQKELKTLSQKRTNVTRAFGIHGNVSGKRILVVDDLFDSGATLEEITLMLLDHGAACVNVLTLTRTIHSDL